ncbi:nucleolar protein 58-like [Ambystoma mexicanum]|uniref:nucleolar protein 58-like n=1 Tax=Ambystoma mexicanum TaxID=8296 RepID=UPI0037E92260
MNPRDKLSETETSIKSKTKDDHSKIPESENLNIQQVQKKVEKTTKTNELMTKWITVTDKKPTKKEKSNIQKNQKRESNPELDESMIDISNNSTYSIENSESEIPRPTAKKRKVSFAENELPTQNRKANQYKIQTKSSEQKKENLEDLKHKKDRITPERKTLFRLSNIKLNKHDHRQGANEEAHPKNIKRKSENERQEEKTKRSDRRHQQTYLTPIGQKGKTSETRSQRSSVTETYDSRRRDKPSERRNWSNQRPLDQSSQQNRIRNSAIFTHKSNSTRTLKLERRTSSEEKIVLNRRAMMKLLDKLTNGDQIRSKHINVVEFAHKGQTDSIFLHITSQSVKKLKLQLKKELLNRG